MNREEAARVLRDRYVLISCEGKHEAVVARRLIEAGLLRIPRERLIEDPKTGDPYTELRAADDIARRFARLDYPSSDGRFALVRIADRRVEGCKADRKLARFAIPIDYVTEPEIEMLILVREGSLDEYWKTKRHDKQLKPSEFCKGSLGFSRVKSAEFLEKYWKDAQALRSAIEEYHQIHLKEKGPGAKETDLFDLLAP